MQLQLTSALSKIFLASLLVISFTSCKKEIQDANQSAELQEALVNPGGNTHTVLESQSFSAVANVSGCLGYNIRFYGTVDFLINKVYDQNGTMSHFTRTWSIKGLEAEQVGMTSVKFDVVAGQEMFSVKDPVLNSAGAPVVGTSGDVFIHQGTVVLENRETHERIVLRHEILKIPGQGISPFRSGWYIRGQKCGS